MNLLAYRGHIRGACFLSKYSRINDRCSRNRNVVSSYISQFGVSMFDE